MTSFPPVPFVGQPGAPDPRRRSVGPPIVSQKGNRPANDCGPACALMLARWNGRGLTDSVEQWSNSIDTGDDGTTTTDLAGMFRRLGLTPVIGSAAIYPYIELVNYSKLPFKSDPNGSFKHWIVRLSDSAYHDPYWTGDAGANLQTTKAVLDAAEVTPDARITVKERPLMPTYKARVPYERVIHVIPQDVSPADFSKISTEAYAAKQSVTFSADDAALPIDGLKSRRIIFWNIPTASQGAYRDFVTANYAAPDIPTTIEFKSTSAGPVTPPPTPTPTKGATPAHLLGVHALHLDDVAKSALARGAKSVTLMSGLGSYQIAQANPDAMVFYRWYTNAPLTADDWVRGIGLDPNGAVNTGDRRFILGMNEYDVPGFGGSPNEIRARAAWDKRRIEILRRIVPNAKVVIGGFPHGNPDITNQAVCDAMREAYAPLYNNQDPANPTIFFNLHNYTKTILREDTGPKADPKNWYAPEWFETRYIWLFTKCGFNPNVRAIVSDETGGELGAGGFNWARYTDSQFAFWQSYYLNLMAAPMEVAGKSYPCPMVASTHFQGADSVEGASGHWGGYYLTLGYNDVLKQFYSGARRSLLPAFMLAGATEAPPPGYVPERKILTVKEA